MELLEGEPLDRWVARIGTPQFGEAMRIGREIALALAAAHTRGLIHRDVKPANVWLEAPTRRVKLLDFGLALPQDADVHLTKSGMIVGTPMYMAPEQARGDSLDGRADLFSLGCVIYLMITGKPPFEGKTTMAVMSNAVLYRDAYASQPFTTPRSRLRNWICLRACLQNNRRAGPTPAEKVGRRVCKPSSGWHPDSSTRPKHEFSPSTPRVRAFHRPR